MSLVLDCSVTVAWAFKDEFSPATQRIYGLVEDHGAVVSAHWMAEVANVLRMGERRGRIVEPDVADVVQMLSELPIEIDDGHSWRAMAEAQRLSRTHGLTVYDAVYLELALRRGLPLATTDADLVKAARATSVPVE